MFQIYGAFHNLPINYFTDDRMQYVQYIIFTYKLYVDGKYRRSSMDNYIKKILCLRITC